MFNRDNNEQLLTSKDDGKTFTAKDGTKYSSLNSSEIDKFCNAFKGDKNIQEMAEIYETKVPRISYDTEKAVRYMRSSYNVD